MEQAAYTPEGLRTGAFRVGSVLAASGPVVLRAFTLGPVDVNSTICWRESALTPLFPTRGTAWELLSLVELLLPVILAGIFLLSPGWTVTLGVCALFGVLVLRLLLSFHSSGTDSGWLLSIESPWPSVACYMAALLMLLPAARPPRPRAGKEIALWVAAIAAAAWTTVRLSLLLVEQAGSFSGSAFSGEFRSLWDFPALWPCKVDADGLLVVLITLAATIISAMADRAERRRTTLATAVLLVVAAFGGYVLGTFMLDTEQLRHEFQFEANMLIRWHLLVAAALLISAAFEVRPGTRDNDSPTKSP